MLKNITILLFFYFLFLSPSFSLTMEQEALSQKIGAELKCPICHNQSIEESYSTMAQNLRYFIRNEIKKGTSEEIILNILEKNYGENIRLQPHLTLYSCFLWLLPCLITFLISVFLFYPKTLNVSNKRSLHKKISINKNYKPIFYLWIICLISAPLAAFFISTL